MGLAFRVCVELLVRVGRHASRDDHGGSEARRYSGVGRKRKLSRNRQLLDAAHRKASRFQHGRKAIGPKHVACADRYQRLTLRGKEIFQLSGPGSVPSGEERFV